MDILHVQPFCLFSLMLAVLAVTAQAAVLPRTVVQSDDLVGAYSIVLSRVYTTHVNAGGGHDGCLNRRRRRNLMTPCLSDGGTTLILRLAHRRISETSFGCMLEVLPCNDSAIYNARRTVRPSRSAPMWAEGCITPNGCWSQRDRFEL